MKWNLAFDRAVDTVEILTCGIALRGTGLLYADIIDSNTSRVLGTPPNTAISFLIL